MKLRDILMYITAFSGIILIAYVRISFSTRQQKSPAKLWIIPIWNGNCGNSELC